MTTPATLDDPDAHLDLAADREWSFDRGAQVARDRSHGLCEVCGGANGRPSQTHHRQPRAMGGVHRAGLAVNRPSCLLRLCQLCHQTIEHERAWAEARGYLVRRPTDPATVPVQLVTVNGAGLFLLTEDGCYAWQDPGEPDWAAAELARLMG